MLPLVGSMITVFGLRIAPLLGIGDHRDADTVLHAAHRIEGLQLQEHLGAGAGEIRPSFTSWVRPMVSRMLSYVFTLPSCLFNQSTSYLQ